MMEGHTVVQDLVLPAGSSYHGSELYREPFRWDQRLHAMVLKFSGHHPNASQYLQKPPAVSAMALATGGSCQVLSSMKQLLHAMDVLCTEYSRKSISLSLEFEPVSSSAHSSQTSDTLPSGIQRICVKTVGSYPLPEEFNLDPTQSTLPPRSALPKLFYRMIPVPQPKLPSSHFPIDVYDMEPSPLVDWVTERVPKGYILECALMGTKEHDGTLPACAAIASLPEGIKLLVLPYNFQLLFSILRDYQHRVAKWKTDFEKYVASVPPPLLSSIRNALKTLHSGPTLSSGPIIHPSSLIPDTLIATSRELPHASMEWLTELKQRAQADNELRQADIANSRTVQQLLSQNAGMASSVLSSAHSFRRQELLLQMDLLRTRLRAVPNSNVSFRTNHDLDEEAKHHVPIGEMGDFQTYLSRQPAALRTVDDSISSASTPKPYFGNPFAKGDTGAFVDEVGVSTSPSGPTQGNKKKRKRKAGVGERADKFKMILFSDTTPSESPPATTPSMPISSQPSASALTTAETSMLQSASPPITTTTISTHPSAADSRTPAEPRGGAIDSSLPPSITTIPATQASANRNVLKERLQKWEKMAHHPSTSPPLQPPTDASAAVAPDSASLRDFVTSNNALKLTVLAAIKKPLSPDASLLKHCYEELRGPSDLKEREVREWVRLASLYHVDISPIFPNSSVQV